MPWCTKMYAQKQAPPGNLSVSQAWTAAQALTRIWDPALGAFSATPAMGTQQLKKGSQGPAGASPLRQQVLGVFTNVLACRHGDVRHRLVPCTGG